MVKKIIKKSTIKKKDELKISKELYNKVKIIVNGNWIFFFF